MLQFATLTTNVSLDTYVRIRPKAEDASSIPRAEKDVYFQSFVTRTYNATTSRVRCMRDACASNPRRKRAFDNTWLGGTISSIRLRCIVASLRGRNIFRAALMIACRNSLPTASNDEWRYSPSIYCTQLPNDTKPFNAHDGNNNSWRGGFVSIFHLLNCKKPYWNVCEDFDSETFLACCVCVKAVESKGFYTSRSTTLPHLHFVLACSIIVSHEDVFHIGHIPPTI